MAALAQLAGLTSGATIMLGAIGYGLLSAGAAHAYAAVGVEPREIGMSSGVVLAQAAIAIGLVVVIMIAPAVAAMFFGRLRRSHDVAVLVAVNLALTAALVFHASSEARTSFQEGKRTPPILGPLALPPP